MNFVRYPEDHPTRASAGGKAGALAVLQGRGLNIPAWFVLLPEALEMGGESTGTEGPPPDFKFSPGVIGELNAALRVLCPQGEEVAVRSSAIEEDGEVCSFAGLLESFLRVRPEEVAAKIVEVWRSAYRERVLTYRSECNMTGPLRPPAVLVQRMVEAEAAGVVFGADPVSGRRDVMVVSAVAGLGSALVDGTEEGETWRVAMPEESVQRLVPTGSSAWLAGKPVLDENQVRAVCRLANLAGGVFGVPQDVEWAFEGGQLYLLQSRPVTTLPPDGGLNLWDNSNISESYSGVTLPLTFSFARRAYTGVYREFCRMLAVPSARIAAHEATFGNMIGLIRGRVYYNLLNWYRVLALLPGFTLNRRFMEQMMGVKEELPAEVLNELGQTGLGARIKDGFNVAGTLLALAVNHGLLPWKIRRFYSRLDGALALPPRPLGALPPLELVERFDDLQDRLLTRWDAPLLNDFFAMIFHGVLRQLLSKWVPDPEGSLANDLLCGGSGMISAEPARRIIVMAELAAPHGLLVQELRHGSLPAILAAMDAVPAFRTEYDGYLTTFGDRCPGELKLESPALTEDPTTLLRTVGQMAARRTGGSAPPPAPNGQEIRQRAEHRVGEALQHNLVRKTVVRWVLRHARARVRDRENLRFERTRLFGRVRRIFVELGQRLHEDGHLDDPRDVFLLEVDELREFVAGKAGPAGPGLKTLVARRRVEFDHYAETASPPARFSTRGPVNGASVWQDVRVPAHGADETTRTGLGCCAGRVRGTVRKVTDPHGAVIQRGEILVAARTDPGWILLFPAAAGLLVERGSLLSHSAIVARELNLPAVVSIEGLTDWLDDGDEVEFDGATGEVRLLARCGLSDYPTQPVVATAAFPEEAGTTPAPTSIHLVS